MFLHFNIPSNKLIMCRPQCMVERALYLSPYLQDIDSLRQFTESVQLGESRWDSLKNTPYSTPGRYVTVLDLRKVLAGRTDMDRSQARLIFYSCLTMLFASLPNLKELYLPEGCGTLPRSVLEALQESPCVPQLRVLHGLEVTHRINAQGIDPLVQLLAGMKELQSLKICGLGAQDEGLDARMLSKPQPTLSLPRLRKLHISAIRNGLLLAALKDSELPALVELQTNTYHLLANDLTHPFMVTHGPKLTSLTIHTAIDWPPVRIPAHPDILSICPNLLSVAYLDRTCPPPPETFGSDDLSSLMGSHPLKELTIAKWSTNANLREITPEGLVDRLFQSIFRAVVTDASLHSGSDVARRTSFSSPPVMSSLSLSATPLDRMTNTILPDLEVIRFQDFTWLRPDLGPAALGAGVNGLLRKFSSRMASARRPGSGRPTIQVLDMHGNECPPILMGNKGSLGLGMRGGQDSRWGMKSQQERRRASFEDDLDG
jgi:hypothetical protein